MELQEKPKAEDCNYEEEPQVLLSARMLNLNPAPIQAKSLLSLTNITQTTLPPPATLLHTFGPCSKENFIQKSIKTAQGCRQKQKLKSSQLRQVSAPKRQQSLVMKNVKLFEIGEAGNGRRSVMTEMKGMRVSEFTGKGFLILPNNKKFEGEWVQGNLIGETKITYPNGKIYFGGIYDYQPHGKGNLYFSTGEKYVGEFSSGDFHGEGTFYDQEGKIKFDGEWRRGKMVNN